MAEHKTWRQLRAERQDHPEYRVAYERARQAFEIGRQVRELREARRLTQAELAARMNTTQSVIARLEAGGAEPRFTTLERVAAALDSTLEVRLRPSAREATAPRAGRRATAAD